MLKRSLALTALCLGIAGGYGITEMSRQAPDTGALATGMIVAATDGRCPAAYKSEGTADFAREVNPGISSEKVRHLHDLYGDTVCISRKHPESMIELSLLNERNDLSAGYVPEGALWNAVQAKASMQHLKADVAGADGAWQTYGEGPLIVNDPNYPSVNGLGNVYVSGRIDHFDYDEESGRLFAAIGTGGVWMSEDLAETWVSVGDNLPYQTVGSVAWSPAGGGTLVAVSGEPPGGGNTHAGLGAFWTNDLGASWHKVEGVPEGALGYRVAVDESRPEIVYIANSKGLYRSNDVGRTAVNVSLPTSEECAGVHGPGPCQYANFVTDVVVKAPGGSTGAAGGEVLAVVGYRGGSDATFPDGRVHAPGNGFYRSATGEPGSFERVGLHVPGVGNAPAGLPDQARMGRVEMGAAIGDEQDHNIVYAIVQDAVLLNDGMPYIDAPPLEDVRDSVSETIRDTSSDLVGLGVTPTNITTAFNGIYMSPDFGDTWTLIASTSEIADNPSTGSSLAVVYRALVSYQPGVQAWYNMWIKPDPTRADPLGFPTRLAFGLEEVYQNRLTHVPLNGALQQGGNDFHVIGTYFAGNTCQGLSAVYGLCPTSTPVELSTTTHPDQQAGIWIPRDDGGVCLVVGNDGGAYRQCVDPLTGELDNAGWGDGHNHGFNTLLPYGVAVSQDGTVWMGLQDNGTAKIDGKDQKQYMTYGGDGFFTAVHPTVSNFAYGEYVYADMRVTVDGGTSWADMSPPVTGSSFSNPFYMDPTDPDHLITAGHQVVETTVGPRTRGGDWVEVYALGEAPSGEKFKMTAVELQGAAAYVGGCGKCSVFTPDAPFQNTLATNVGGDEPFAKASSAGWHTASAAGLPNRYITAIEIDPADPAVVYVTLGGYSNAQWIPPGSYLDDNADIGVGHVFKSTDAGETFVDVSGNLPNTRATAIKVRNGQLLVGTDLGMFISTDTQGSRWAPMGNGLPNVVISGMQFQPGRPDRLFASTFGRGIYTYDFAEVGGAATEAEVRASLPTAPRGGSTDLAIILLGLMYGARRRAARHSTTR